MTDVNARSIETPEPTSGLSRRGLLAAAGATAFATGAAVLGSSTIAEASDGKHKGGIPVITIDASVEGGMTVPATVPAGIVTFKITGLDDTNHAVQGFSLKRGATVEDVLHDLDLALLGEPPDRALGHQLLMQHATLFGGALTFPNVPIYCTVALTAGTYYFLDIDDIGTRPVRVKTFKAVGHFKFHKLPRVDGVIKTRMENDEPRFITPTALKAKGTYLFINTHHEIHEVVFRRTRPEVTDEYITAFYDAVLSGGPRPESPWLDLQHGLQAMSPWQWAIFSYDLPPGSYSEICYVPSDEIGIPHAYQGMHQQVTLA
jgi:hypothetical protein